MQYLSLVPFTSPTYRGDKRTITVRPLLYSHKGRQLFRPSFYSEWCQGQAWSVIYVCESVCLWSFSDAHAQGQKQTWHTQENPFSLVAACKDNTHRHVRIQTLLRHATNPHFLHEAAKPPRNIPITPSTTAQMGYRCVHSGEQKNPLHQTLIGGRLGGSMLQRSAQSSQRRQVVSLTEQCWWSGVKVSPAHLPSKSF